jgi:AcrR family transcriptional regulator
VSVPLAPPHGEPVGSARRRLSPDDRRREVLEAAIRVLRDRGPASCRVEDITAEAGTAKGNFYRYFRTWDDLLLAVREHLLDTYREELSRRFADRTDIDWWRVLDDETDRFLAFQLRLGGLHEAIFHGPAATAQPIEHDRSAASMLSSLLAAGIADGAFAPVDTDITATLLFDLLHGAADAIASGRDHDQVRRATLHLLHRALELDDRRTQNSRGDARR